MLVRCTAKALGLVGRAEFSADPAPDPNEWYLNLLWFERRKCLLLVHAATLYPTFIPDVRKPDVRPFGAWAVKAAIDGLAEKGLPADLFGHLDPNAVSTAKTASRRILGFMNEMALHIDYAVFEDSGLQRLDLPALHHGLRRTLHKVDTDYARPLDLVTAIQPQT